MTREVTHGDGKYIFWLAGYYDDFLGARTLPDNLTNPADTVWHSSKSHQGNPINGYAELNPRYKYAWCVRGDGDSAQFNNPGITSTDRYTFNTGVGAWSSLDITRQRPLTVIQQHISSYGGMLDGQYYENTAQLQYPDSLTNANRQRFDGGTGIVGGSTKAYETTATDSNYAAVEGYMMFCNGYDTSAKYYSAVGSNDSTFGRDTHYGILDFSSGQNLATFAGRPITGATHTDANNAKTVRTHLAGVYSGEVVTRTDVDAGAPDGGALMPIESVCGKPFLVIEASVMSSSYKPVFVYDGSLNSKGSGDYFIIRMCPMAVDNTTTDIKLRIGCDGTAFTSAVGGDTGYSHAAIELELSGATYVKDFQYMTTYAGTDMSNIWDDWEIYIDYDTNRYSVFLNGVYLAGPTAMGAKADGTPFQPADMYGWEIDVKDAEEKAAILIDRVGLIRPLNDEKPYSYHSQLEPVAVDFQMSMGVNSTSTLNCTIVDDDKIVIKKLMPLFQDQSYASYSLLMFHGGIDRPLWRGTVNSLSVNEDTNYTPTLKITASDYLGLMDNQIPTWEVGQSGEGDSTSQVAYNRSDSQNNLNTYYFGASSLDVANATLGFNEVEDGAGNFVEHLDTRMRNRSAHPIQMYTGEDTIGPNNAYSDWEDAITAGHATTDAQYRAIQSLWMGDIRLSPWFRHMFSKIAKDPAWQGNATSNFTVGGTTLSLDGGIHLPNIESSGSIEVVHSDGFVDSATYTSAAVSTNKSVTVSKTGVTFSAGYAELIEVNYGRTTESYNTTWKSILNKMYYVDLWLPVVTSGHPDGGAWSPSAKLYGKDIALSGWTGTGDTAATLNGVWNVVSPVGYYGLDQPWNTNNLRTSATGQTLTRVRLKKKNGSTRLSNFTSSSGFPWIYITGSNTKVNWTLASIRINGSPTGGVLMENAYNQSNRWAVYRKVETFDSGTVSYGTDLTLPTTNFLQRNITTNETIKVRDIDDNNYKHIWILWSDMRNNGEANADNNSRRKSFGLMSPYSSNYQLTLDFANSAISNSSERQSFTDLNIGEEVDLWEIDATADPITGEAWSDIANGSIALNRTTTLNNGGNVAAGATSITLTDASGFPTAGYGKLYGTATASNINKSDYFSWTGKSTHTLTGVSGIKYEFVDGSAVSWHNTYTEWDKMGGSFVIIDTSKFFNLNTVSNGGRTGQDSGGRKEIGDYLVETEGFPVLIDNYWKRAPTSFLNLDDAASWSDNAKYFINQGTTLLTPVLRGDRIIQLNNKDAIPPTADQVGIMVSEEKNSVFHYSTFADTDLVNTSVVATAQGAGKVRLTAGSTLTIGGATYNIAQLYRTGHKIVVSASSGTGTSIDGTYDVIRNTAAQTLLNGAVNENAGTITLDDNSDFSTAGFGFINDGLVNVPFTWTGKSGGTRLTGCQGIHICPDNSPVAEIASGAGGYLEINVAENLTISTGTVTVSAPTSLKLRNLVSLGKPVEDSVDLGVWNGTAYPRVGSTPSSSTPENNGYWLTYYGGVGGLNKPQTGSAHTGTLTSTLDIEIDPEDTNAYRDLIVYGGLANIMPMSLLMVLNGFVETRSDGTWYDSEKFRTTYLDCLNRNWLTQSSLAGMTDIASLPITRNMNTTPTTDAFTEGRGGLISDISAPSSGSSSVTTTGRHGLSTGDVVTFIECIPLYSSKILKQEYTDYTVTVLSDTEFSIPNTTPLKSPIPVAYNELWGRWRIANTVDDFGGVNDCRNTTISTIFSSTQALSGVSDIYSSKQTFSYYIGRDSKIVYRPNYNLNMVFDTNNMKVQKIKTQNSKQVTNVRVFYGGGGSFVDYPAPVLGNTPRWEILTMPSIDSNAEALKIAHAEYEKYKKAPLQLETSLLNYGNNYQMSGKNNIMLNEARYGYIADQSRTIPKLWQTTGGGGPGYDTNVHAGRTWSTLKGGNLFPGMVSALNGRDGDAGYTSGNLTYDENYYWYGANSVSYAVQVVHIPRGMPKVSQKTPGGSLINADGKLRIAIEVGNGIDAGTTGSVYQYANWNRDMCFTIRLLDYDWTDTTFAATERSSSTVTVDSNGLWEIDIPSTYWSSGRVGTERITLSVNYDYLMALARRRCDGSVGGVVTQQQKTYDNSNPQEAYVGGILLPAAYNETTIPGLGKSIFPLGMRSYPTADYWHLRTEWYAPRLHICDDINFTPGAQVIVNNTTVGLNSENMGIKSVQWSQSGRQTTKLNLLLERDVSISKTNFASLFVPPVQKGTTQTGGEGSSKGGGSGSGTAGRGGASNPSNGLPAGFSPSSMGGNAGNPKVGGWGQTGGFGGIPQGTAKGAQLNPISYSGTGLNPDGLGFGSASAMTLSSNNLALGTMNKMMGSMDFNNDSVIGSQWAVLGQKKPSAAPRNESGVEGIDSFVTPSGDGVMSDSGMSFAGWAGSDAHKSFNEFNVKIRVPDNPSSAKFRVEGKYTLNTIDPAQVAYLQVTVSCVETSASDTANVTLFSGSNQNVLIYEGTIEGADKPGNTLSVSIGREAGVSPDTASYSAVNLHNIQVATDRKSVSGKAQSSQFSYSD